jgi:glycosyltransferase involved in cell wall biosynthesis
MDARGTSPVRDAMLFFRYIAALRRIRPAVYLGYTAKPNIYGSLAAHALGIPVINNIAGLGVAFLKRDWLNVTIRSLYRVALARSRHIFFQNPDDLALFAGARLVDLERTSLLPGSGVDLSRFQPVLAAPGEGRELNFLLLARLLWAKGVRDYVEAARLVRAKHGQVRFRIAGPIEPGRKESVQAADLEGWQREELTEYLGPLKDVRPALAEADCVVLPSYYPEGTPRSLLEAAAMAKPLISCDVPGCREIVRESVNGLFCEPRTPHSLAAAMERIITMPDEQRAEMGMASRREVERRFDERFVIRRYVEEVSRVPGLNPQTDAGLDPHSGQHGPT